MLPPSTRMGFSTNVKTTNETTTSTTMRTRVRLGSRPISNRVSNDGGGAASTFGSIDYPSKCACPIRMTSKGNGHAQHSVPPKSAHAPLVPLLLRSGRQRNRVDGHGRGPSKGAPRFHEREAQ